MARNAHIGVVDDVDLAFTDDDSSSSSDESDTDSEEDDEDRSYDRNEVLAWRGLEATTETEKSMCRLFRRVCRLRGEEALFLCMHMRVNSPAAL